MQSLREKTCSRESRRPLARETRFFSSATQVKPCRAGLRNGWVTHCEYRLEVLYFVLLFFLFSFACCVLLFLKAYWKAYLALFGPLDLEKKRWKHKHGSTVSVKIIMLRTVVQNRNFDLWEGKLTGKLINLGFPRCKTNSKLDFRGKRQGFDGKKPNWNALWRNISRHMLNRGHNQTRLRSETHLKLLRY